MNASVTIQKATINDIDNLSALLNLLFAQEAEFKPQPTIQKKGLKMILEDEEKGIILMAKQHNNVVGMVNLLFTISTALGSRVAILEDMVVHTEHRNQGIGQQLIEKAIQTAKAYKCQRITLLTDNDNINAHRFYERNNFEKSFMLPFRKSL